MNELQVKDNTDLMMWDDSEKLAKIKELFAPKLSDPEFQMFVGMGRATGLNPFTREIWAVKYADNAPAQIFIGRDGYRKAAQAHSEYDFHQADAVYDQDDFQIHNGEVHHSYKLSNRGNLVGAYCIAKRHKASRPIYVFAELKEYTTGRSVWKDKPATMIKKVAESQCLRACFQDLLGGTYGEEEMEKTINPVKETPNKEELLNKLNANKGRTYEAEETGEVATPQQVKDIHKLMSEKEFQGERLQKALAHYGVETMGQLTKAQADDFIAKLNKV